MDSKKEYLLGIYEDEDVLLEAVKKIRGGGIKIHEVYSPFPVHGLTDALGYRRSRLSIIAFLFGLTGTTLALTMQAGMMTFDWPMIIGGKDFFPLPAFIPVTFELTVLLAAFGMVGTFLVRSGLKPWGKPNLMDIRITDDKHVVAIDLGKNQLDEAAIKKAVKETGASEINNKTVD